MRKSGSANLGANVSSHVHPSYFAFTVLVHFVTSAGYLLAARSERRLTCCRRSVAMAESRF